MRVGDIVRIKGLDDAPWMVLLQAQADSSMICAWFAKTGEQFLEEWPISLLEVRGPFERKVPGEYVADMSNMLAEQDKMIGDLRARIEAMTKPEAPIPVAVHDFEEKHATQPFVSSSDDERTAGAKPATQTKSAAWELALAALKLLRLANHMLPAGTASIDQWKIELRKWESNLEFAHKGGVR